ncbi:MAG: phosphatidylserine decarboxylase [Myxococcales bacterium]|nr:MAG: phosphatidylserine decarboxylase [Myxococcales bacterium]
MNSGNITARLLRQFPQGAFSQLIGRASELRVPSLLLRPVIASFAKVYDVDVHEAEIPAQGFESFDDFFTRRLRSDARPLASGETIMAAPSDGKVIDVGPISGGGELFIKGQQYTFEELLGGEQDKRLQGGSFAVLYLSPRDYHRVHCPLDARVCRWWRITGTRHPVNALGMRFVPKLFASNERVVVHLYSEHVGDFYLVMVAAAGVGNIELSFDPECRNGEASRKQYSETDWPHLEKGEELGVFHLGSTVVLLTTKESNIIASVASGEMLRMGQALGHKASDE